MQYYISQGPWLPTIALHRLLIATGFKCGFYRLKLGKGVTLRHPVLQ